MFCKNCGAQVEETAVVCVRCGAAKGAGVGFCANCGRALVSGAAFCSHCGTAAVSATTGTSVSSAAPTVSVTPVVPVGYEPKSKLAAGLFGIFLGYLGIHNFYLGYVGKGVAQVLLSTLGACLVVGPVVSWVWSLIEGIQILTGSIAVDAKGVPLKE